MSIKTKCLSRNFLIGLICILLLTLFIFLSIHGYSNLKSDTKNYMEEAKDMIDQRMTSLIYEMNIFPGGAGGDVVFLSKLSRLREIGGLAEMVAKNETEKLAEDFVEFLKENNAYYQLRYINENGMEVIRADFDGEDYQMITQRRLQDKSLRYYFNEAISLDEGEVYISQLDLNIENQKIENRGTEENPIYVPVIRFATPVFDDKGNNRGIIIVNVYADYFLNDVRRAQRAGEIVFLINEEGYYLAHPNKEKEFAFMFDEKEDNLYKDYPEVAKEILSAPNKRRIETEELIFSYRYIYPTAESYETNKGTSKIFGENPENRYFWILVSVSDKGRMNEKIDELKEEYIYFLLFPGLIILVIIALDFRLIRINGGKKK